MVPVSTNRHFPMLRRLYDWTMDLATRPYALWALAIIAFVESSVFPIPPDLLLAPMVLAAREKAWKYSIVCTVSSVLGGIAGYAVGYFLFDSFGQPILDFYGMMDHFESFKQSYNEWGAWIVAGAGMTPFPYKVITITSGVTQLNFGVFMIASILARGARFFLVAGLLWKFGPPIRDFVEKYLGWVTAAAFALLVGGFVAAKYLL